MSITAAEGFEAFGLHAGIKRAKHDMALLATADRRPVACAAVFTQNKFFAPPVAACRSRLSANGGRAAAVVVSSGNANAGTGPRGLADAEAMCGAAAAALGVDAGDVLVCSTGIIGEFLPIDVILAATPKLADGLSRDGGEAAALGILTTDSRPKQAVVHGSTFIVGGMAKGCGMLAPNMATMLAFLTTDADVSRDEMQAALKDAVDRTFNTLNVDGATSTNDTVILMASGARERPDMTEFADAVHRVCEELTLLMARDAEGMTKVVTLAVTGAASDAEARAAAKAIGENNLVKCSWHGADPYWGRLLSAAGSAGVGFDPDRAVVAYGGTVVSRGSAPFEHDTVAVAAHMAGDAIAVEVGLGVGDGSARLIGVDLGPGYIKENSQTS